MKIVARWEMAKALAGESSLLKILWLAKDDQGRLSGEGVHDSWYVVIQETNEGFVTEVIKDTTGPPIPAFKGKARKVRFTHRFDQWDLAHALMSPYSSHGRFDFSAGGGHHTEYINLLVVDENGVRTLYGKNYRGFPTKVTEPLGPPAIKGKMKNGVIEIYGEE